MWEASELGSEELLWSAVAFNGGIGEQQQAPCGSVSASAVFLGLRHRCPLEDKQRAKQARHLAREEASELTKSFIDKFGALSCQELTRLDFSQPGVYRQFLDSGGWKEKCNNYVRFAVDRLYEFEEKRSVAGEPQKVVVYTKPGCPYCAAAIRDLGERGVSYEEVSIESNPKARAEVMRLSSGTGIVPVLVEGDKVKVGFGGG